MTGFFIGAAVLVVVTLILLLRPAGSRQAAAVSHRQLNASIYRDQMAELERDLADGELLDSDYAQARQELQRRVIEDSADDPAATPAPAPTGGRGKTPLALAILVPLAALALYGLLGNPAGISPPPPERRFSQEEIERMVEGFAAKLEKEPGNTKGWAMLARSYKALGRLAEADKAYQRLGPALEQDAQLLADYADLLIVMAGGKFEGKPLQLLAKALKLDPDHVQALWLVGTAAFNRGDHKQAIAHWERALRQLPPESEEARLLGEGIAEAKAKVGKK